MSVYLDDLTKRMDGASTCKELSESAREALQSLQQGIDDAQAEIQKLAQLIVPPTTLPGVIAWIKAQIELYLPPYQAYLEQAEMYAAELKKIEELLSEKARELACKDLGL